MPTLASMVITVHDLLSKRQPVEPPLTTKLSRGLRLVVLRSLYDRAFMSLCVYIYFIQCSRALLLPLIWYVCLFSLFSLQTVLYLVVIYYYTLHGLLLCIHWFVSLHWRHNDHDGVSNHQPHGCLLKRLFRRRSKKTSKLRVTGLCVGNSPGPVNSPHKGPVTRIMFPFDVIMYWKLGTSDHLVLILLVLKMYLL